MFQALISIPVSSINLNSRVPQACPWMNAAPGMDNGLPVKVCYGAGNTSEEPNMRRGTSIVFGKHIKKAESLV